MGRYTCVNVTVSFDYTRNVQVLTGVSSISSGGILVTLASLSAKCFCLLRPKESMMVGVTLLLRLE